jgi:hypothetical protein
MINIKIHFQRTSTAETTTTLVILAQSFVKREKTIIVKTLAKLDAKVGFI